MVYDVKPLDAPDVDITERDIREAIGRPGDFGISPNHPHVDDFFVTWSLGPMIRTRDSTVLEESNADALLVHLKEDPSLADDWSILTASHWGVGWVEHLTFRALEEDEKTPTRMFRVLKSWFDALSDYPVADDSDYSDRMYEGAIENIAQIGRVTEEQAKEIFTWMWDHDQEQLEESDGEPAYPSRDAVRAAMRELKMLEDEE